MSDLKFAWRQLLKNPGFTAVAVLTLALGIGANSALFSVVNGVLFRPLPYPEPERLVTLWERSLPRGIGQQLVSPPNLADWQSQNTVFEKLGAWRNWANDDEPANLVTPDGTVKVRRRHVSSSLFAILGTQPFLGRVLLPEEDQIQESRSAVLGHDLWQQRFGGDSNVLGRTLTLDTFGRRDYTIVGVMPPGFRFPDRTELWLNATWNPGARDWREAHWLNVIARLKPGVTLPHARAEMNAIQARLAQEYRGRFIGSEVAVVPLLEQTVGRNTSRALMVLWGVVAGVLLIACANVANLLLARAAARQREIAVRVALGASRWSVIRQLLIESVLLGLAGGAFGLLLGFGGIRLLVAAHPGNIPRLENVTLDGAAILFTVAVSVVTGVLFGLAPAWQFSRPDLSETLKDNSQKASAGLRCGRVRQILVVSEVALSLVLLIGSVLMLRSFARLTLMDRGFEPEHVVTVNLDFSVSGFTTWVQPTSTRPQVALRELMERLRQRPGVRAVGAAYRSLMQSGGPPREAMVIENRPVGLSEEPPRTSFQAASPDYFRALGVRLIRGRDFTEADHLEAPPVVIINEAMARRYFQNGNPIGKRLAYADRNNPRLPATSPSSNRPNWQEIVGVVADVKNLSTDPTPQPETYFSYWQFPMQSPTLVVRTTGEPASLASTIRGEVKAWLPNLPPPTIRTMNDLVSETIAQPRFQTWMLSGFGLVALGLAAMGLYGVLAYAVAQRTQEIGIRMALGARRRDVLALVIGQGMRLALAGVLTGILAALALTRVMKNLLYEVEPTDPITFAGVSLLLLGIALFACWLPARRAAKVDPIVALRTE